MNLNHRPHWLHRAALLLFIWLALAPAHAQLGLPGRQGTAPGAVVQTEQVRAELLAHAPQGVRSGATLWVGLQLAHQPHWHTYWQNPGDSGLPTQLAWTLPAGVSAGEIVWPLPKRLPIGKLVNYGYEGTVLLPVPLKIAADYQAPAHGAPLTLGLKASWLVCRQECIPEDGEFSLSIPVQGSTALHGADFDAARQSAPKPWPDAAASTVTPDAKGLLFTLRGLPAALHGKTLVFFPQTPELIHNGAVPGKDWTQSWQGDTWTARLPLSPDRSASPAVVSVVVAHAAQGYQVDATVQGAWPALASGAPAAVSPALQAALDQARQPPATGMPPPPTGTPAGTLGLGLALVGAFLGGLLLNLMPCVFPILAIKMLGFARHARDHRAHRLSGLAFTGGVMLSFLALGALMLALRAAGEQLGWGFQLQSPTVVAVLAVLFTVIGLNLAGVFEIGQIVPSGLASLEVRHPVVDAFLSGVLAVAVASPCTAPFMGASLGLALSLPATQALAVFAAIGLGMAVPYLVASVVPAVAQRLPRPGPWMEVLRKCLAFPMWGTVVWLLWVLGQQTGMNGAAALLALLVALAWVLWALSLQGRTRRLIASFSIASFVLLAWTWGPYITKMLPDSSDSAAPVAANGAGNAPVWQAWAPDKVDALLAQGKPVFVDFTAAWCVTCQYNKANALADPDVLADFQAKGYTLLRADWTRRDPAITQALQQLERSGVPVYLVQRPGAPAQLLPEILRTAALRAAL